MSISLLCLEKDISIRDDIHCQINIDYIDYIYLSQT